MTNKTKTNVPDWISFSEASGYMAKPEYLIAFIKEGKIRTQGRFTDEVAPHEPYGASEIPAKIWENFVFNEAENLLEGEFIHEVAENCDPTVLQWYFDIKISSEDAGKYRSSEEINKGGRPTSISKEKFYAEMAVYFMSTECRLPDLTSNKDKKKWRDELYAVIPSLIELNDIQDDVDRDKSVRRYISEFANHFQKAMTDMEEILEFDNKLT